MTLTWISRDIRSIEYLFITITRKSPLIQSDSNFL